MNLPNEVYHFIILLMNTILPFYLFIGSLALIVYLLKRISKSKKKRGEVKC